MHRLLMTPGTGERLLQFVGDRAKFALRDAEHPAGLPGWRAFLRTNLGRAAVMREETIAAVRARRPVGLTSWRDIPLRWNGREWEADLVLTEVGYFRAKAYAVDPAGWQHWPDGPDVGITVQPDSSRTANTIYCAFTRLFGSAKVPSSAKAQVLDAELKALEAQGCTVIPSSGTLRDLTRELPHIFRTLGCRILHLLPVNPTPTVYARFGRFGSPYAVLDLTAIDLALVEFDRRTTGVDQFRELTYGAHSLGGRVFLDIIINHTGWGARLHERHPEWFARRPDGTFVSPSAWGVTWEDLVELDQTHPELREELADALLEWCHRGVDGFRCDAGYKVPVPVWQYVTARVRQEFPETVFLLEGLGGGWEQTEALLTEGGMQWAYSELFQNCDGLQVSGYLDHALQQSARVGLLAHYSETHDNNRLAARGRQWSLLRNQLCALTSVSGAYGFTCGVEFLATEKIRVHGRADLRFHDPDNIVEPLARLNRLLADHPCFFDGAGLTRLSPPGSPVYALLRVSASATDAVLVLVNTDPEHEQTVDLEEMTLRQAGLPVRLAAEDRGGLVDLLENPRPGVSRHGTGEFRFRLAPAAANCLAACRQPKGLSGENYRLYRARAALALTTLSQVLPLEQIVIADAGPLAQWVERDLEGYLSALARLDHPAPNQDLLEELTSKATGFPRVVAWRPTDCSRVFLAPPEHWLVVRDEVPFRATLSRGNEAYPIHVQSVAVAGGHAACFAPSAQASEAQLAIERYGGAKPAHLKARISFLAPGPRFQVEAAADLSAAMVLLTNGRGGMARLCVDLGNIRSKYDCLLGANLHPRFPVDRHILAKRARVWVNADGFLSPLNGANLAGFEPGPPARWRFVAHAGDGRMVEIRLCAAMLPDRNATALHFSRPAEPPPVGRELEPNRDVRLTVRIDIEDRNFHHETKRNPGAEHHFSAHCRALKEQPGFVFAPAPGRQLQVWSESGLYHSQPEWCESIPHIVERSRGLVGSGDAYSPGWFELPLPGGGEAVVILWADSIEPSAGELGAARSLGAIPKRAGARTKEARRSALSKSASLDLVAGAPLTHPIDFEQQLLSAARAFLVRRDNRTTVIAGYPWFLDWGRDTLICARGLLAAGLTTQVQEILATFGQLERDGTVPNALYGEDSTNRDTSDAPLWYGLVCEEAAAALGPEQAALSGDLPLYSMKVNAQGRCLREVLLSIAAAYLHGTPNGIRVDPVSGLVWSPSHFTWMDTNHPAATPREGYPIEVQALWIRLLRQLARLGLPSPSQPWSAWCEKAQAALERLFWLPEKGYFSDVLLTGPGQPAEAATPDTALRSNCLLAVSLSLADGDRARRCVEAALHYLLVPGALRSLAPLPVAPPLPVRARDGCLLNNPLEPYWGRYEGDEDTRRKPAYHNGTAWTWTLPGFCEALARAWDFEPAAVAAARSYLGSVGRLLAEGCLGHLPEVLDGDAPHCQRGCDAQAWSVLETLRVWKLLKTLSPAPGG